MASDEVSESAEEARIPEEPGSVPHARNLMPNSVIVRLYRIHNKLIFNKGGHARCWMTVAPC